ncbi:hypothetical protein [Amycolatopsis sp. cmx-4-83]|uniref:hypothetical protein n=1 Tax=Amycolatopsis sp. cmx-4-83 TaxID=2790940 RepID=UPI00397A9C2C
MRSRDVVRRPAARVRSVTGRRLSSLSAPVQYNGLGTAGFVLGLVGLVICVLWMAAFGKAVSDTANGLPTAGAAPSAAAAQHTVVLEVTTAAKANVQWGSGFTANSQEVLEKGKSRRQALSMDDLAFTPVTVTAVDFKLGAKDNTCKITVDGPAAARFRWSQVDGSRLEVGSGTVSGTRKGFDR